MSAATVLLVRHGRTEETLRAVFPATTGRAPDDGCVALDRVGRAQARALAPHVDGDRCWASHAVRAHETASALGWTPVRRGELAELDFGRWAGRCADDVALAEPGALDDWYADPDRAPHGGERLTALRGRAAGVLDEALALGGTTIAVTHGGFVKAALLEVLGLPPSALWQLDADPGSVTELHISPGWRRVARLNWSPLRHPGAVG